MQSGNTQQFGKYLLQRKLAEGGMAELFLAKQSGPEFCDGFEKLVVIKRILPQLCSDESFVNMFLNEARVAARLNHPNVVQIFDLGKLGDQYFIAMEYVHGEDVRAIIRELTDKGQRPPLALACRVIADVLGGLHYAHTRAGADGQPLGLVHRDVSPQNVLVTFEGSVKLVDFGIAKATRVVGAAQTQAGLLKGKYSYMSPEQARGQPIDARADVFCAGVLLWELATWQRLFKRPTDMATLMAVAEEPIRAPRSVEPSLPPELDRIIVKALARNPGERFATAQEMRAELESLIRTSRWEADTLALSQWMRELFAAKLRAQAADVAASGLASLEDFLLTVEEKTSISWMAPASSPGEKKTPSSGLPPSKPASGAHPATTLDDTRQSDAYDDGATVKSTDVVAARAPDGIVRSHAHATTLKGGDKVPAMPGVLAESLAPLKATPTAATLGVVAPEAPRAQDTPSMALGPDKNPLLTRTTSPLPTFATAKRPALTPLPPSPMRRVLVAGSAALLVAAVALTVAFWPTREPAPLPSLPGAPTPASPGTSATGTPASASAGAASTGAPPAGAARPSYATLIIHVDAPANIAVDGSAQPMGSAATVNVQPGVEHVVTVQRPGHPVRTLHVPALAPGERLPLSFTVR